MMRLFSEETLNALFDDVVALQIKLGALEELLLTEPAIKKRYEQLVDQLGLIYTKERAAAQATEDAHLRELPSLDN